MCNISKCRSTYREWVIGVAISDTEVAIMIAKEPSYVEDVPTWAVKVKTSSSQPIMLTCHLSLQHKYPECIQ